MIPPPTATCPRGYTADDLSAWRDDTLPTDQGVAIGDHIPQCAACQATVRAFEAVGQVLRQERLPTDLLIPSQQDVMWRSVRARQRATKGWCLTMATAQKSRVKYIPATIVTAALVALVVIVFMLFAPLRSGPGRHPLVSTDPTTFPTPQQVWGVKYVKTFDTSSPALMNFQPAAVLPDGSAIVGFIPNGSNYQKTIALFNSQTGALEPLYTSSNDFIVDDNSLVTDGVSIAWDEQDNTFLNVPRTHVNEYIRVLDIATRQARAIVTEPVETLATSAFPLHNEFHGSLFLAHNTLFWTFFTTKQHAGDSLIAYDLATNTSQTLSRHDEGIFQVDWPLLLYTSDYTGNPGTTHLLNLANGNDVVIPTDSLVGGYIIGMVGTTAYAEQPNFNRQPHVTDILTMDLTQAHPDWRVTATIPIQYPWQCQVNARLVACWAWLSADVASDQRGVHVAWDFTLQKVMRLDDLPLSASDQVVVAPNWLTYTAIDSSQKPYQSLNLANTANLPQK